MNFELIPEKKENALLEWAKTIWPRPSRPSPRGLSARGELGEVIYPVGTDDLPVKSGPPAAGEWSESKPVGWRTALAAEERGGLTGVGCSMMAQT
jgi:hypothetical protein